MVLSLYEHASPLALWSRWDTKWYVGIAEHGYHWSLDGKPATAFFPLYPLLLRLASSLLPTMAAGIVLSSLAFAGALFYLHGLMRLEWGREAADRSVWLLALFPTAFFTFAPYTEALFLLAAAGALYHLRRHEIVPAGLMIAVALLTRSTGVALIPALIVALWGKPARDWWWAFLPSALSVLALAAYLSSHHLSLLALATSQHFWHRAFTLPWTGFTASISWLLSVHHPNPGEVTENLLQLAVTVIFLWLTILAWRRLPLTVATYCLALWALWLTSVEWQGNYFAPFSSMDRFVLALFPLTGWAATVLTERRYHAAVLLCAALMTVATGVHLSGGWVG